MVADKFIIGNTECIEKFRRIADAASSQYLQFQQPAEHGAVARRSPSPASNSPDLTIVISLIERLLRQRIQPFARAVFLPTTAL